MALAFSGRRVATTRQHFLGGSLGLVDVPRAAAGSGPRQAHSPVERLASITMINRRTFPAALVQGAAAVAAGFAGVARAQSDTPRVLGQSAPLTGPAAQLGLQFNEGAKLWLDVHNAQPGVRRVTPKALDDGYEPERSAANTTQLLNEDVLALFGYIGTATRLAALPLAVRDKTPVIAPFTGAMSLREPLQRNVFHLRASHNDETALIVRQLVNMAEEDRRLPPERRLRPGRPDRRDPGTPAAQAGARRRRHLRTQLR